MKPATQVDVQQFKKVFILFNRYSGKQLFATTPARIYEIYRLLREHLQAHVEMLDVRYFEQMPELARRVVDEHCDWVIIAGGDGTIRAFVEDMLRLDYHPYISVFPAGTVNLIAKEMTLRRDPVRWVRRALRGNVYDFYTAWANGNLFLTVASVGFDSLVVDNVGFMEKRLLNKFAYILTGTQTLRKEVLFNNWKYEFEARFLHHRREEPLLRGTVQPVPGGGHHVAGPACGPVPRTDPFGPVEIRLPHHAGRPGPGQGHCAPRGPEGGNPLPDGRR